MKFFCEGSLRRKRTICFVRGGDLVVTVTEDDMTPLTREYFFRRTRSFPPSFSESLSVNGVKGEREESKDEGL